MSEINQVKGYPASEIEVPESITTADICTKCGNLAVEGLCDRVNKQGTDEVTSFVRTEYFAVGTVPEDVCICHSKYTLCSISGKLSKDACPASARIEKVYMTRFLGDEGTTDDTPYELPASLEDSECKIH